MKMTSRESVFLSLASLIVSLVLPMAAVASGTISFASQQQYVTGNGTESAQVGDINGDGKPDIVASEVYQNTISISYGNGDGTFQSAIQIPTPTNPLFITLADLNADGKLDVASQQGTYGNN